MIRSLGPPDKYTPGNVGDYYCDTLTDSVYRCTGVCHPPIDYQFVDIHVQTPKTEYAWEKHSSLAPFFAIFGAKQAFYQKTDVTSDLLDNIEYDDTTGTHDMSGMFYNCIAMTRVPSMNTSDVTCMDEMFYHCVGLTLIHNLQTDKVTSMFRMFSDCENLTSVFNMNTSNVVNMAQMFYNCKSLTTMPDVDMRSAENTSQMFRNCKALTGNIGVDLPSATDTSLMFNSCSGPNEIKLTRTNKIETAERMFSNSGVKNVTFDDLSSLINALEMFNGCETLVSVLLPNTISLTNMLGMFQNCKALKAMPELVTDSVTSMYRAFYGSGIVEVRTEYNTSQTTNMGLMFEKSTLLKTFETKWNTTKVSDFAAMFRDCTSLETVKNLDVRSGVMYNALMQMFNYCSKLTTLEIKNIRATLQIGSGTSYGHLLTLDSLIGIIGELIDTGSMLTLTVGTANLEKLANVYVKTITITDEMRAEDEFIDSKLPFEVCESTDEGATLITNYVGEKHWQLK